MLQVLKNCPRNANEMNQHAQKIKHFLYNNIFLLFETHFTEKKINQHTNHLNGKAQGEIAIIIRQYPISFSRKFQRGVSS